MYTNQVSLLNFPATLNMEEILVKKGKLATRNSYRVIFIVNKSEN
jgi:hypothetical protein